MTVRLCFVLLLVVCSGAVIHSADASADASTSPSRYEWGTYRPNVYFGVRARHGSSPLFGLLWGGPYDDINHIEGLRHDAEERDHITKSTRANTPTHSVLATHPTCDCCHPSRSHCSLSSV